MRCYFFRRIRVDSGTGCEHFCNQLTSGIFLAFSLVSIAGRRGIKTRRNMIVLAHLQTAVLDCQLLVVGTDSDQMSRVPNWRRAEL